MTAWLALACWAATGGDPAAGGRLSNRLVLRIAAQPAVVAAVAGRLGPRLAGLGVALDLASAPDVNIERILELPPDDSPEAPLARGWIDAQDLDRAVLLIIPRRADRVLMRVVPLTLGVDEAGLAQVTFIVERSMASLLASQPIGVPHAEARAALDAVPPAGSSSVEAAGAADKQLAVQVGVFGGVAAWSSTARLVPRLGLDVWTDWIAGDGRVGVAVAAVVDPGFRRTNAVGAFTARALAVHAWLTAGRRLGAFGIGRVAVGPALLITHVAPTLASASSTDKVAQAAQTDLDPLIGLVARWDIPVGETTSVFLAATVDIAPVRARYIAVVDGDNRALFSPWSARPGLVLGVSLGSERQRQ